MPETKNLAEHHKIFKSRNVPYLFLTRSTDAGRALMREHRIAHELRAMSNRSSAPQLALAVTLQANYLPNWRIESCGSPNLARKLQATYEDNNLPKQLKYCPDGCEVNVTTKIDVKPEVAIFSEPKAKLVLDQFFKSEGIKPNNYIHNFMKFFEYIYANVDEVYIIGGEISDAFKPSVSENFFEVRLFMKNKSMVVFRKAPIFRENRFSVQYALSCSYGSRIISKRIPLNRMMPDDKYEELLEVLGYSDGDKISGNRLHNSMSNSIHTLCSNEELLELV